MTEHTPSQARSDRDKPALDHPTPSQAEGDRDDEQPAFDYPTPSQAEGDRDDDTVDAPAPGAGGSG
ncbi:hypothetical protein ACIBAI_00850 [Streptomyces sp. NPDC051041]|uniref:hypothetical protein n=1 Tax=Streptomyces sp. NPDC051041 TaxID=3365640 RepID=UPI0037B39AC9